MQDSLFLSMVLIMKKLTKFIGHIVHFINKSSRDNISAIAGQSAFFIILSFVPFLMFAFAILSFFNIPKSLFDSYLGNILPEYISSYINQIIYSSYKSAVGVAFTTIILALWSSGKGIYSITEGIRVIYKLPNRHNWFVKRILSMGYTFLLFIVVLLAFTVFVLSKFFESIIEPYIKKMPSVVVVLYGLRYFIMFVIIVLLIAIALKLYLRGRVYDKAFAKFRLQLPGAIFTAVIWTIMSELISIYVKYFGGFSVYGSLTTAAVIMVWLYFTMLIFLYSVQFNYIYRTKIYNFRFRDFVRKVRLILCPKKKK